MSAPICPECKSDALTVLAVPDEYDGWVTACCCTRGRSTLSAAHSVKRWIANARKRYELRAVAILAARSGQP